MYLLVGFLGGFFAMILVFMIFAVALKNGYLDNFETFRKLRTVTDQAIKILQTLFQFAKPNEVPAIQISDGGKSASVMYMSGGQKRLLSLPLSGKLRRAMRPWEVFLYFKRQTKPQVITLHPPGLPYLCSAQRLGGTHIMARNKVNDEIIKFGPNEVPMYLGFDHLDPDLAVLTNQSEHNSNKPLIEEIE